MLGRAARMAVAACLLMAAEAGLRIFSLRRLIGLIDSAKSLLRLSRLGGCAAEIAAVDRFFSPSSCLRRALAARAVLGPDQPLRLGVRWSSEHTLEAHAWIGAPTDQETSFQEIAAL